MTEDEINGEETKYYKYKATSGKISISNSIARALKWKHHEELQAVFKTIDGSEGLFIFKKKKK